MLPAHARCTYAFQTCTNLHNFDSPGITFELYCGVCVLCVCVSVCVCLHVCVCAHCLFGVCSTRIHAITTHSTRIKSIAHERILAHRSWSVCTQTVLTAPTDECCVPAAASLAWSGRLPTGGSSAKATSSHTSCSCAATSS